MELGSGEIAVLHHRGEFSAVVAGGDSPLTDLHGIGVHEIEIASVRDPFEQRVIRGGGYLIPAHVRQAQTSGLHQTNPGLYQIKAGYVFAAVHFLL